ncbi:haloacid dehalogenase type II [Acetobacteraceae bacterium H6797]|nr:haloacid dehalogenase type II [Acetobacteraceae bacterium H6797]
MSTLKPKFITFDCYGTLTRFQMGELSREILAGQLEPAAIEAFIKDFTAYRLDEVLGPWKPYSEVIVNAWERTCRKYKVPFKRTDGLRFYHAVPTWTPHEDVPIGLSKAAKEFPLVGLSNASNDQIMTNVGMYGAPFHAVYTAQMAQAYKPRMQAFEYMFDMLGCNPEDVLHVSSSLRYDLQTAYDMRIGARCHVQRGHEPTNMFYVTHTIKDISGLPGLLGL